MCDVLVISADPLDLLSYRLAFMSSELRLHDGRETAADCDAVIIDAEGLSVQDA